MWTVGVLGGVCELPAVRSTYMRTLVGDDLVGPAVALQQSSQLVVRGARGFLDLVRQTGG